MNNYLSGQAFFEPGVSTPPEKDLSLIIVIPALDERGLLQVFEDLLRCSSPQGACEVIAVVNHAENAPDAVKQANTKGYADALGWATHASRPRMQFHLIRAFDLPAKKAGVGLARKIGMDEAVSRFVRAGHPEGIITCLDADCRVPRHYLSEIETWFSVHPKMEGAAIGFAHALRDLPEPYREAIIRYELHLRYFIGIQKMIGFPFAYQTIGSAMAVKAHVYAKVGGMNLRKAGEDFYFLHKVIERGAFGEINTTCVFPSARLSDRVPFGTGRAMLNQITGKQAQETYHPAIFVDLKTFFQVIPATRETNTHHLDWLFRHTLAPAIRTFLFENNGVERLLECARHTATPEAYEKRVFRWFNAFVLMKFVHFARDQFYGTLPVGDAAWRYLHDQAFPEPPSEPEALLLILRKQDGVQID